MNEQVKQAIANINKQKEAEFTNRVQFIVTSISQYQRTIKQYQDQITKWREEIKKLSFEQLDVATILGT